MITSRKTPSIFERPSRSAVALAVLAGAALAACDPVGEDAGETHQEPPEYSGPPIPWAYEPFPEVVDPADNPSSDPKIELGRLLFYDPILSRDQATACATCHSEEWGLSDGLVLSIGVDGEGPTGPGRTGENLTTRNAQTLWNAAFRDELFWDGRAGSLEEQALEPLKAEGELDLDPDDAAAAIAAIPGYATMFADAFPGEIEPVTAENLARALAAFERTMISRLSPYDRYVAGDEGALSDEAKQGMQLFADAGCAGCHQAPLFESHRYELRVPSDDEGRMAFTEDEHDRGKFRVPTLRNLRETGPYFHDGSATTLEEAVAIEAARARELGEGVALTEEEVGLVSTFLRKALMDRSQEPERPDEVPSGLPVPEDGFRIPR